MVKGSELFAQHVKHVEGGHADASLVEVLDSCDKVVFSKVDLR